MRKSDICICNNKGTDHAAVQCRCSRHKHVGCTISLLFKSEISFYGHTAQFVCGLIGNHEEMFSIDAAQYCVDMFVVVLFEPRREKPGFLHMRKQRPRSASP